MNSKDESFGDYGLPKPLMKDEEIGIQDELKSIWGGGDDLIDEKLSARVYTETPHTDKGNSIQQSLEI